MATHRKEERRLERHIRRLRRELVGASPGGEVPNLLTQPPDPLDFVNQFPPAEAHRPSGDASADGGQELAATPVRSSVAGASAENAPPPAAGISGQTASGSVNQFPSSLAEHVEKASALPPDDDSDRVELEAIVGRVIAHAAPRGRGRPPVFDDLAKGKLIALLALGLSLRQAGAVLGVSHETVRKTLQSDPSLSEEITAARFQAQVQPLACVVRESRRSWKAATWLLKYLDGKIAGHEETPEERKEREKRERDEFFGST